jgi:hypothetical protein
MDQFRDNASHSPQAEAAENDGGTTFRTLKLKDHVAKASGV